TQVPLSMNGDVPQIFVFRVYGAGVFFFILASSALSLSPSLVLWTGATVVAAMWGAWVWIVSGMERRVSWDDLPQGSNAEQYMAIVLDPDFTGIGNRVIETLLLLATSFVTAVAVQRARDMLRRRMAAERSRAEATAIFGRFVPTEVATAISARGGAMAPSARRATVMFVDVEGFTRFAEGASPDRVVAVLDAFFESVSDIVAAHRGVVVNLTGDAALAAFNAPLENARHAADALAAAEAVLAHCGDADFAGERLGVRIGLATGAVAAGVVGGAGRRAYTLYGDTVNMAQRLERLNKDYGGRLLATEATWVEAGGPSALVRLGDETLRGRTAATVVYGRAAEAASEAPRRAG
ncbi:MAG: adenylate/guanylate cyclase domain-containing protein, partial [Pseudomonadota bacterium]